MHSATHSRPGAPRNSTAFVAFFIGILNCSLLYCSHGLSLFVSIAVGLLGLLVGILAYWQIKSRKGAKRDASIAIVGIALGTTQVVVPLAYFVFIVYLRETGRLW